MTDQAIAAFALMGLARVFIAVYAWQPVHVCRWTHQCPHWKLDQARIERDKAKRTPNNDDDQ